MYRAASNLLALFSILLSLVVFILADLVDLRRGITPTIGQWYTEGKAEIFSRRNEKNQRCKGERASTSLFLFPVPSFGLIARRLKWDFLMGRSLSYLSDDTFFAVTLQMAWFLKRSPPRRLTNIPESSAFLKGTGFRRDLAFSGSTFPNLLSLIEPVSISPRYQSVCYRRLRRKIPPNDRIAQITINVESHIRFSKYKRTIGVSRANRQLRL
jgi:hypothetical protein